MAYGTNFYESVLRKFENDDTVKILNIKICDACGIGENFVAKVERVFIQGLKQSRGYEISVIVKSLTRNLMAQKFHFENLFENEVHAYKHILPTLEKHSASKLLLPECIHVADDVIVLQDLSNFGCKSFTRGHRFSVRESESVLKELAKLHAASLRLQQREPQHVDEFKKLVTEIYLSTEGNAMEEAMRKQIQASMAVIEASEQNEIERKIINELSSIEKTGYKEICDTFLRNRKVCVFNHGDTWGSNIMFRDGIAYLVDFQMMRFTSVAADLSYFFYINLRPSERRDNLDNLLHHYLECLKTYCRENSVTDDVVTQLSFDWLKSEMKEFELFGFLTAIFMLPVLHFAPENLDVDKDNYCNINYMNTEYRNCLREYVLEYLNILQMQNEETTR